MYSVLLHIQIVWLYYRLYMQISVFWTCQISADWSSVHWPQILTHEGEWWTSTLGRQIVVNYPSLKSLCTSYYEHLFSSLFYIVHLNYVYVHWNFSAKPTTRTRLLVLTCIFYVSTIRSFQLLKKCIFNLLHLLITSSSVIIFFII